MGLAASQARLLTITSRKADCEFQSMRLSHQKIALSRNMTDISNEYQDALNQVSLVYDYYGTNDKSTVLSYGLLMTPGELNGHMPTLTTDAAGKVVLNSRYAAAARAAGIPTEGLGCLPSTDVRNKFLDGLASAGFITVAQAETYKAIEYSQQIGQGTTDLVTATVEQMTLNELLDYYMGNGDYSKYSGLGSEVNKNLQDYIDDAKDEDGHTLCGDDNCKKDHYQEGVYEATADGMSIFNGKDNDLNCWNSEFSIKDMINNKYTIVWATQKQHGDKQDPLVTQSKKAIQNLGVWDWMFEEFEKMLSVPGDAKTENCIAYAKQKTEELLTKTASQPTGNIKEFNQIAEMGSWSVGYYYKSHKNNASWDLHCINISLIAEAFLTYFAMEMQGKYTDFKVNTGAVNYSKLIKSDAGYKFDVLVETGVNADQSLNSGHYDAMFNQLCLNGWVENDQVNDNEYLHHMYQSGKLFISTCNDDGFYYQGNYNTNKFIKEVADDEAIARAEAKYNSEKQRINSKEEVIDMKMKNLDTEISSLTTEYDTIKSLISNNIKKSFTRYDA